MLWEINAPMEQAETSPVKTMELSTVTQVTILPLTTVVVQFKKRLFEAYPCQQLGHSSRVQTCPWGPRGCRDVSAESQGTWWGAGGDSVIYLADLPCRARMHISKAEQDQAQTRSINLLRSVSVLIAAGQEVATGKIFCWGSFPREIPVSAEENFQRKRSILLVLFK